jgi:hypothetical protein
MLKGSGIGSTEATSHVSNLIRGSRSALGLHTWGQNLLLHPAHSLPGSGRRLLP